MVDEKLESVETEADIEGLIFLVENNWVAMFTVGNETFRSQIDFCPWCGSDIRGAISHKCDGGDGR